MIRHEHDARSLKSDATCWCHSLACAHRCWLRWVHLPWCLVMLFSKSSEWVTNAWPSGLEDEANSTPNLWLYGLDVMVSPSFGCVYWHPTGCGTVDDTAVSHQEDYFRWFNHFPFSLEASTKVWKLELPRTRHWKPQWQLMKARSRIIDVLEPRIPPM